jgi:hypothetical protein
MLTRASSGTELTEEDPAFNMGRDVGVSPFAPGAAPDGGVELPLPPAELPQPDPNAPPPQPGVPNAPQPILPPVPQQPQPQQPAPGRPPG